MKFSKYLVIAIVLTVALSSCESEPQKTKSEIAQEKLEKDLEQVGEDLKDVGENIGENIKGALKDLEKSLGEVNTKNTKGEDGEYQEPVNFREMKKYLPRRMAGLSKSDESGETGGFLGLKISTVNATYGEGDEQIDVKVVDAGGMSKAIMGMAKWSSLEIDREDKNGYERTTTFEGHKAYEKYNKRREKSELHLIIENRIIVSLTGKGVDMDGLYKGAKKIDLDDLADLGK